LSRRTGVRLADSISSSNSHLRAARAICLCAIGRSAWFRYGRTPRRLIRRSPEHKPSAMSDTFVSPSSTRRPSLTRWQSGYDQLSVAALVADVVSDRLRGSYAPESNTR
jgi:hypothetical protein